jgi:hypothetical protein
MKIRLDWLVITVWCSLLIVASCKEQVTGSVTVPVVLDHNRMLVDAEIQRTDGSWCKARLWVDTGNPSFYLSETLARDLGIILSDSRENADIPPPTGVRIDGMQLNFDGVRSRIMFEPHWLFSAMHNDGNLPSSVLKKYHVVLDYPGRRFTIAEPGTVHPRGTRVPASFHSETGIPQIDAVVDGDSLSFALDNGASYSFVSYDVFESLLERHPDYPHATGATGCANMWGWWPPQEQTLPVMRLPEVWGGPVRLTEVGIVGVPEVAENGPSLGAWYSQKTARPVVGFLGPNAFEGFRVEIDYANSAIYFEKGVEHDPHDMDLVGLTLRPEKDRSFTIIGVAMKDGIPVVEGIEPGDVLLRVGDLKTTGATFGTVVDALRGKPGDVRVLEVDRNGKRIVVETKVARVL